MSRRAESFQNELESNLRSSGADLVGFGDVSDLSFVGGTRWRRAIAIGIAYDPDVVDRLDEEVTAFERHLAENKEKMQSLLEVCERFLSGAGFRAWIPPISKNLPGLLSDFPHKTAATRAGLGWVGKNSLFVSPEFGCGMRLASVLTDAPLECATPTVESRCGRCTQCVEACPYNAIKGETWNPGAARDKLLDAFLCSEKREEYIQKLGYKHPCGLCIKACPFGKKNR